MGDKTSLEIQKPYQVFKLLIATSLALALSASVAVSAPFPCINGGTCDTNHDKTTTAGLNWNSYQETAWQPTKQVEETLLQNLFLSGMGIVVVI